MKKTITFMLLLLMAGAAMSQGTFTCGEQISDVEGNTYETVEIGGLCWTKENMKSKTYSDGSAIAKAMIYSSSMYPDTNANLATYGRLYTWFSAVNVPEGSSSKPTRNADGFVQGICPDGWHIPTVGEMNKLNVNSTESLRSVELWLQPNNNTNSTGFSSLPAGYYSNTTNRFEVLLGYTYYWSDSSSTPEFAIACDVNYFCDVAKNEQKTTGDGVSVRCVKDYSPSANTFTCGTDKVTDVEGHDYNTVLIGDQCWMKENLRTTKYANGIEITAGGGKDPSDTEPYYYEYPETETNIDLKDRGLLYNWSAAINVCPDGWHLPSDAEWNIMEKFVSGPDTMNVNFNATVYRGSHAGKLAGGDKWTSMSSGNVPGNMDYAERNASGFSAVPAGGCFGSSFYGAGAFALFWSSTQDASDVAWYRGLDYNIASVFRYGGFKGDGLSVRCLKNEGGSSTATPTVTTAAVTSVTAITATCGGEVTTDGGAPVTACGVCWSISPNPTINDSLTTNGSDIGRFTSSLTRLIPGTTYYVRAYATNSEGTAYGNEVSFTAQNGPCPLQTTVSDNDGHTYNTVLIGNQCWMKENLRTTKYPNGSDISTEDYHNYNTSSLTLEQRGLLYNWTAVMNGANSSEANPSGVQGICPTGWHVPSAAEWKQLRDYVLSQNEYTCSNTGGYAKALASPIGWNPSESPCAVGNTPGNNNATGFSALPVGFWSVSVLYGGAYNETNFWSSTEGSLSSLAFAPEIVADGDRMSVDQDQFRKTSAFSVRCIRDVVIDENSCAEAETVTDKEGNVYATVKIGNQCWMRENLRTKKYKDGTDIAAGENNTSVTKGYYYDVTSTGIALTQRGYHYNWPAANLICPNGWHLPSDAEWNTMEQTLSGSDWQDDYKTSTGFRGSHAGKLALAGGNESGFSAVPAGACVGLFSSTSLGYDAYFWSSTPGNSEGACSRALDHNRAGVERSYYGKFNGFSVRCVKD